ILHLAAAQVAVGSDVIAHRAAPELRARHPRDLAEDVPQRQVNSGDCCGPHNAVAVPEMLAEHPLPEVLDPRGILADDQLGEVFDRADDAAGVPFEGGLAPAEQAVLVGEALDEDPVAHGGVAAVGLDAGDLQGVAHLSRAWAAFASSVKRWPGAPAAKRSRTRRASGVPSHSRTSIARI